MKKDQERDSAFVSERNNVIGMSNLVDRLFSGPDIACDVGQRGQHPCLLLHQLIQSSLRVLNISLSN